jgi:RNA polymerase sigma-70 factor (ECF subfamily)
MQAGTIVGNLASAIGITTEDASLVADLKAGSEEAFAMLIAQYHQPLYSLIARSLNDPADAPTSPRKSSSRSSAAFAASMAKPACAPGSTASLHEASNQRRWWSRHKKQEITIDSSYRVRLRGTSRSLRSARPWPTTVDSPFDHAAQAEVRERVEAALRQLPEAFRTVVILREIEGFAYEEIAEILERQPRHGQVAPHPWPRVRLLAGDATDSRHASRP